MKAKDQDPLTSFDDLAKEEEEAITIPSLKHPGEPSIHQPDGFEDSALHAVSDEHHTGGGVHHPIAADPFQDESEHSSVPYGTEHSSASGKHSSDNSPFFYNRNQNFNSTKSSKKQLLVLIIVGVAVISATVFLLKKQFTGSSSPSPSTVAPVETPTQTPTPTPQPVDRSKYKVRILNGTTKTGLAASVSSKLKDLGYQGEKVANATNSSFTQTLIRIKPNLTDLLDQLIRDLAPDFVASSGDSLKEDDGAEAEVILGTR